MTLLRLAAPLVFLALSPSFAAAQVYATSCTLTTWDWTFNSLTQSPCTVAAYLMASCDNGVYTLGPEPSGYAYSGPGASAAADLCYCNTVGYSLFSACAACQGNPWIAWSTWVTNCTKVLPPSSFPNPVPLEVRVPQWALVDVTNENYWNYTKAYTVGDLPEISGGSTITPSSSSSIVSHSVTATSSPTSSSGIPSPGPIGGISTKSSSAGAIAGGVVGGIAAISIAIAAIFFYRRRRLRPPAAVSADVIESKPLPFSKDEGTTAPSSPSGSPVTMRFYDPNDPATFPAPQSGLHSLPSQVTMSSNVGSGSTAVNTQTSLPHTRGYHGHPMV